MVNLQIYPQTALLFLIDALRSTGKQFRLDLYVDSTSLGAVLSELGPDLSVEPRQLYVENEIQVLLGKFMQALQAEPEVAGAAGLQGSLTTETTESPSVEADATGVP